MLKQSVGSSLVITLAVSSFSIFSAVFNPAVFASPKMARCLLVVSGKTYIDGDCEFTFSDDKGSFSFDDKKIRYGCAISNINPKDCPGAATTVIRSGTFGYLDMEGHSYSGRGDGTPVLSWNYGDNRRAIGVLGKVRMQNGCWVNDKVKACFYAK